MSQDGKSERGFLEKFSLLFKRSMKKDSFMAFGYYSVFEYVVESCHILADKFDNIS